MNLNTVLNTIAPASGSLSQGKAAPGNLDFDALIENASVTDAKPAMPEMEGISPERIAAGTRHVQSSGLPLTNIITANPGKADTAGKTSESAKVANVVSPAAAIAVVKAAAAANISKSEASNAATQSGEPVNAPPTFRDLTLRTAAEVEKAAVPQDTNKPEPVKPEITPAKIMADKPMTLVKTGKPVQSETSTEEADSDENAPLDAGLPLLAQPAQPTTAMQSVSAVSLSASPAQNNKLTSDNATVQPHIEGAKEKIAHAVPELPSKVQSSDQSVSPFALPAPVVTATASMTAPVFGIPESFSSHQLDLATDTQWIDQLAREIVSVAGQDGKMRFGLSPNNLGHLEVTIESQQEGVNIQLQASTESAAKIFAAEQPKLLEELRQSGVRVSNNDLMGGHHMQGQRDPSRTQNPAWQTPSGQTAALAPNRNSSTQPTTSRSGRFA